MSRARLTVSLVGALLSIVAGPVGAAPTLGLPLPVAVMGDSHGAEKTALGKRLFFDNRLSADGQVSCATCHVPGQAFSDGKPVAIGVNSKQGTRNTPSVLNMQWQHSFFWDGRRSSLETQMLDAFVGPAEQGLKDHAALLRILQGDRDYRRQFARVFDLKPDPTITTSVRLKIK